VVFKFWKFGGGDLKSKFGSELSSLEVMESFEKIFELLISSNCFLSLIFAIEFSSVFSIFLEPVDDWDFNFFPEF
jgi:hypothetical protein